MKRDRNFDCTEEQLFDTGTKLIDAYERIEKLEKMLDKAVTDINKKLRDDPDCEFCTWQKQCAKGTEKKCMEDAQWKHAVAAYRLIRGSVE